MSVRISEGAAADLEAIKVRLSASGEASSLRLLRRITARLRQIEQFPESGRVVPEFGFRQIREVFQGPYRIVYHMAPEEIRVLMVVHGAMDLHDLE